MTTTTGADGPPYVFASFDGFVTVLHVLVWTLLELSLVLACAAMVVVAFSCRRDSCGPPRAALAVPPLLVVSLVTGASLAAWAADPGLGVLTLGPVLLDARDGVLHALPTGWSTTSVTDTAAYGTRNSDRYMVTADGRETPTGSGVTPIGVSGTRAVVTSSVAGTDTVYGLPVATAPVLPTPSVPVSAAAGQPAPNPVPSPAPTPTTTTTAAPAPPPAAAPAPPAPVPGPPAPAVAAAVPR